MYRTGIHTAHNKLWDAYMSELKTLYIMLISSDRSSYSDSVVVEIRKPTFWDLSTESRCLKQKVLYSNVKWLSLWLSGSLTSFFSYQRPFNTVKKPITKQLKSNTGQHLQFFQYFCLSPTWITLSILPLKCFVSLLWSFLVFYLSVSTLVLNLVAGDQLAADCQHFSNLCCNKAALSPLFSAVFAESLKC